MFLSKNKRFPRFLVSLLLILSMTNASFPPIAMAGSPSASDRKSIDDFASLVKPDSSDLNVTGTSTSAKKQEKETVVHSTYNTNSSIQEATIPPFLENAPEDTETLDVDETYSAILSPESAAKGDAVQIRHVAHMPKIQEQLKTFTPPADRLALITRLPMIKTT